jgi:hypothetical protein
VAVALQQVSTLLYRKPIRKKHASFLLALPDEKSGVVRYRSYLGNAQIAFRKDAGETARRRDAYTHGRKH